MCTFALFLFFECSYVLYTLMNVLRTTVPKLKLNLKEMFLKL